MQQGAGSTDRVRGSGVQTAPDLQWRAERLLGWFRLIGGIVGFAFTWNDAGVAPDLNHTIDQAVNIAIFVAGLISLTALNRITGGPRLVRVMRWLFVADLLLLGAIKPINAHWDVITPQPGLLLPIAGAMRFGAPGAAIGSVGLAVSQTLFEVFRVNVWELPTDIDNSVILVMIAIIGGFLVGRITEDAIAALATERHALADEADVSARLEQLDRRKNSFVNVTSHELRTPVAILLGGTEVLIEHPDVDGETRDELLSGMYRQAKRLARLAEELELIGSLDGGLVANPDTIDAVAVVRSMATSDLVLEAMDQPCLVRADERLLTILLEALLDNADTHGRQPTRVWFEQLDDRSRVHVQDSGDGIPPDVAEFVFERFHVADDLAHTQGSGLGLPISRSLAELMEGRLWLETDSPGGAHLVLELPVG